MPIWRSSELLTGRPGSPSRRASSARPLANQASSGRPTASPPLRYSDTDGTAREEREAESSNRTQATVYYSEDGIRGAKSSSGCEASQAAPDEHDAAAASYGTVSSAGSARSVSRQTSAKLDSPVSTSSSCNRGNTYTLQYIGLANGELGILSQKQKLAIPARTSADGHGPMASSHAAPSRRQSRISGSSSASSRPPKHASAAAAAAGLPRAPTAASATAPATTAPQAVQAPAPAARPPSLPLSRLDSVSRPSSTAISPDLTVPASNAQQHDVTQAANVFRNEADDDSLASARSKPPCLTSIVDDAYGQVKVVTECFYSRALQSRSGPHDRHVRRNRPTGPPVRDMEPLSTALPGCFGNRAPSGGGFPGWKLAAPGIATNACPRRTYSGSGGSGLATVHHPQRATSAQPMMSSAAAAATARGPTAAVAVAAAAAAAAAVISRAAPARPPSGTATSACGRGREVDKGPAASAAAAGRDGEGTQRTSSAPLEASCELPHST